MKRGVSAMLKRFFQIKIIRRYLFSYLLLFFLPLIVLNGVFYHGYQKSLQNELIENQKVLLEKMQMSTEYELSKLRLISNQITLKGFASNVPFSDPVKGMNLIQFLATQIHVNPFLSDILIYYPESELFYSSNSSYTQEYFQLLFEDQPDLFNDLTEFFKKPGTLYTAPPSILLPSKANQQRNLTMVYPMAPNGLDATALLFFLFPSEKLENICTQYYDPVFTTILMLNEKGELLSSWGNQSTSISNSWNETKQIFPSFPQHTIQDINGQQCLITSSYSESLGWTYLSCTRIDSALASSILLRNKQFIFTLFSIVTGSFLILLCMYYNFLPLYHLIDKISSISVPLSNISKNELDRISDIVGQLSNENLRLNTRLEDTKIAAKEYVISQLITGHALKKEYLERSTVQTLLSPTFDRYTVFTIYFAQSLSLMENTRMELIGEVEAFSQEDIVFFCKEDHAVNTFVCIVLMNRHVVPQFPSILTSMKQNLAAFINGNLSFGVGNIYELMESFSQAYLEADTALDYRFILGNNTIIFFSSIKENVQGSGIAYPYDQIQQFTSALSTGNIALLEDSLNSILSYLSQENISLFQVKSICQDMIRIISKVIPDISADETDSEILPSVFLVSQFETVNDILSTIRQVGYMICKRISSSYDANSQILMEHMKTFLEEKACDPAFSQEMLASQFHMAVPNLSAFYKEHTGETINQTVTQIRMAKAQLLLSTTTLSITQIAINTGYDNVSSFIRRFKQIYHMPPGEWRETHFQIDT